MRHVTHKGVISEALYQRRYIKGVIGVISHMNASFQKCLNCAMCKCVVSHAYIKRTKE